MKPVSEFLTIGANPEGTQVKACLPMTNRHGLVAGATGTGKTVTLQVLAEAFSTAGVPVLLVDVKGDLSGMAASGKPHRKIDERVQKIGLPDYRQKAFPVEFWDVYGEKGTPVRATLTDMGALLLSSLLELNDTQQGVLDIAFAVARDRDLPILNLDDLRSLLDWMDTESETVSSTYGRAATQSISAIQRRLFSLGESGADQFFNEPALSISDFMRTAADGRGVINILNGERLILNPGVYCTFLFWLMSELFEALPEVGDAAKPKLIFFFDEAHLLFENAPKALLDRLEQVVRLIRSKGVGVYFVTQSPSDIPEDVLGQLGHRVQHALRAFTPKDQKAVKSAAETFRPNPKVDVIETITTLGVGEALVSVLDEEGVPTPVEATLMNPPQSRMGPLEATERQAIISQSVLHQQYRDTIDRESAHERLQQRMKDKAKQEQEVVKTQQENSSASETEPKSRARSRRQSPWEAMLKSFFRTLGTQLGRQLIRAITKALGRR